MSSPPPRPAPSPPPAPLTVAAGVAFVQGLVVIGGAVAEARSMDSDRIGTAVSVAVFFSVYGLVLLWCAWSLRRVRPWARGPVLLTQLVCLGLAWNLRDLWPVATALVLAAVVVLAGLLHPRSIEALELERAEE